MSEQTEVEIMLTLLRDWQPADMLFMQQMLYEAVFWRAARNKPSFEEAMADPEIAKSVADWGKREGDTAVIATINTISVGAAWYRYWTHDNFIRGYIDETTPALVIGVHHDYRRRGIGKKMIGWLIERAVKDAIQQISLMVSKDNHALNFYRQQGFQEHADQGDSILMVRQIS